MNEQAFLQSVAAAAQSRMVPDPDEGAPVPLRGDHLEGDPIDQFTDSLTGLGGVCHGLVGGAGAIALLVDLLRGHNASSFLAWDGEHLPVPGVIDRLADAGLARVDGNVPADPVKRQDHQMGYFDVPAGITGADAALSLTGSIVVASGPGRPRMASLIPALHIALVPRDRIWPTLRHWIDDHPDAASSVANWSVITGPSRTADIEQVITRGVHGPREVHVVFV